MKILLITLLVLFIMSIFTAVVTLWAMATAQHIEDDGEHVEFRRNMEKERWK